MFMWYMTIYYLYFIFLAYTTNALLFHSKSVYDISLSKLYDIYNHMCYDSPSDNVA